MSDHATIHRRSEWQSDIGSAITRLEDYRTHHLQDDITRANQPPSDAQRRAKEAVQTNFLEYQNVNRQLSQIIRESMPPDLGSTLSRIGQNQQKVEELKKEIEQAKVDLETSEQRDSQIKQDPPQVSNYQGITSKFGITKPFHTISVSILIGASFFLLILSILLFKENFFEGLFIPASVTHGVNTTSTSFLKDPRVWGTLFGASCVAILFLSLKIANKLPILPTTL